MSHRFYISLERTGAADSLRTRLTERSLGACGLQIQQLALFLGRSDPMVKLRGTEVSKVSPSGCSISKMGGRP
jgi:hypothetical protein